MRTRKLAQPKVGTRGNVASTIDDCMNAIADADRIGELILAHPGLKEEFFFQKFARMRIMKLLLHYYLLRCATIVSDNQ